MQKEERRYLVALLSGVDGGVFCRIVGTHEGLFTRACGMNLRGHSIARARKENVRDADANDGGNKRRNPPLNAECEKHGQRHDKGNQTHQGVGQPCRKVFHSTQSTLGQTSLD